MKLKLQVEKQPILSQLAVSIAEVHWGDYDLVIAFENATLSRIALRYLQVVFASIIEDLRLEDYQQYRRKLPEE